MKVLLACYSTNDEYKGGCDYALVDLTPELARKIQQRIDLIQRLHRQDSTLWRMTYNDYSASFLGTETEEQPDEFPEALDAELEDFDTAKQLPDALDIPEPYFVWTECDHMKVNAVGYVSFFCYPRHCDNVEITTAELPREWIEQMADVVPVNALETHP